MKLIYRYDNTPETEYTKISKRVVHCFQAKVGKLGINHPPLNTHFCPRICQNIQKRSVINCVTFLFLIRCHIFFLTRMRTIGFIDITFELL